MQARGLDRSQADGAVERMNIIAAALALWILITLLIYGYALKRVDMRITWSDWEQLRNSMALAAILVLIFMCAIGYMQVIKWAS